MILQRTCPRFPRHCSYICPYHVISPSIPKGTTLRQRGTSGTHVKSEIREPFIVKWLYFVNCYHFSDQRQFLDTSYYFLCDDAPFLCACDCLWGILRPRKLKQEIVPYSLRKVSHETAFFYRCSFQNTGMVRKHIFWRFYTDFCISFTNLDAREIWNMIGSLVFPSFFPCKNHTALSPTHTPFKKLRLKAFIKWLIGQTLRYAKILRLGSIVP